MAETPMGFITPIGPALVQPMVELLETLMNEPIKPPNPVQTGRLENGYSAMVMRNFGVCSTPRPYALKRWGSTSFPICGAGCPPRAQHPRASLQKSGGQGPPVSSLHEPNLWVSRCGIDVLRDRRTVRAILSLTRAALEFALTACRNRPGCADTPLHRDLVLTPGDRYLYRSRITTPTAPGQVPTMWLCSCGAGVCADKKILT